MKNKMLKILGLVICGLIFFNTYTFRIIDPASHFDNRSVKAILSSMALELSAKCANIQMAFGDLLKEDAVFRGGIDVWGNKIELQRDGAGTVKLISRGEDKKLGTSDDIIVTVQCQKDAH